MLVLARDGYRAAGYPEYDLFGHYLDQAVGSLTAYGYHKGSHPDCKQRVASVVARPDGIFLDADVCDGNQDDTTGSRQALLDTSGSLTRCPCSDSLHRRLETPEP